MSTVDELVSKARRSVAARDMAGAASLYRKVLELTENPEALLHLSHTEARTGSYRKARDYAVRALAAGADKPGLAPSLLLSLRHFHESEALRRYIDQAAFLRSMPDHKTLQLVSAQLSWLGDQDQAVEFIDRALKLVPEATPYRLARAQMHLFAGRFDAAEADTLQCLRERPGDPNALWTLAGLRKWNANENHVDIIRRSLSRPSLPRIEQARLNYALHKELDDLGDIAGAAAALDAACRISRADQLAYGVEDTRRRFAKLKALPLGGSGAAAPPSDFTPVFIVGMFRSGTTLLEQLMGGYNGMVNAGELHDMAACMRHAADHYFHGVIDDATIDCAADLDYAEVGQHYMQGVRWRLQAGHTHITDKWPPNHVNTGFICQAMPQAKVIHMTRDPVETCFSNLRELFAHAAPYSYDQLELADYHNEYMDLMRHWHERFPGRILDVHYADLTRDTEATMRKVAEFCGFPFSEGLLQPNSQGKSVSTASAVQVRDKVIARAVPKWKPYESYLQPLIGALR